MLMRWKYPSRNFLKGAVRWSAKHPHAKISAASLHGLEIHLFSLLDDLRWFRDVPSEDVSFDKVRKPHCQFMGDETLCWDREDFYKGD